MASAKANAEQKLKELGVAIRRTRTCSLKKCDGVESVFEMLESYYQEAVKAVEKMPECPACLSNEQGDG